MIVAFLSVTFDGLLAVSLPSALVTTGVTVACVPTSPNFDRSRVTARGAVVLLTWTTVAFVPFFETAAVLEVSSVLISRSPGLM